jgi:hypothetical protein
MPTPSREHGTHPLTGLVDSALSNNNRAETHFNVSFLTVESGDGIVGWPRPTEPILTRYRLESNWGGPAVLIIRGYRPASPVRSCYNRVHCYFSNRQWR